ncbi:MAG: putative RNase [Marmoricola sp.]|nr:putative RNase [Marmoricola sp.]
MTTPEDLAEVVRREQALLDPALRAEGACVEELLHPDFVEHGASGRVWDRDSVVAAMSDDPAVAGPAHDLEATALAEDVVLLTYRVTGPRGSLRSSVWVRTDGAGWRVRFHQGTRVPS